MMFLDTYKTERMIRMEQYRKHIAESHCSCLIKWNCKTNFLFFILFLFFYFLFYFLNIFLLFFIFSFKLADGSDIFTGHTTWNVFVKKKRFFFEF